MASHTQDRAVRGWLVITVILAGGSLARAQAPLSLPPERPPVLLSVHARAWAEAMVDAKKDKGSSSPTAPIWKQRAGQYPIEFDWLLQEQGNDLSAWLAQGGTALVEQQVIQKVAADLGDAGKPILETCTRLTSGAVPSTDPAWLELFAKACQQRRARRIGVLLAQAPRIVFTRHYNLGGSHYAYTEGQSDAQGEAHFVPPGALCWLQMQGPYAAIHTWLADPNGVLRDPDVSFDGKRVLFAWKKSRTEDDYHLYELDTVTRRVRQVTAGLGLSDYEGIYTPGGDILFNSTRCVQTVDCWWTEVSNLYTCAADGRFLRRLSFDQVHTNYPQMLPDGCVIYTRWDYNDRGQIFPQPLFQMAPDGTKQTEFYGNNSWFPTSILHARAIPGTGKVVATISGHHSRQYGKLAIIDPALGRQENQGVQRIAPVRPTAADRIDAWGQEDELFQYPYPLSPTEFIVGYCPLGDNQDGPWPSRPMALSNNVFGIYWFDLLGRRELLALDGRISCSQPIPLAPRPVPHVWPSTVNYAKRSGTYYIHNVYLGQGLAGIPKGAAKTLRVVALEFRAAGIGANDSDGPAGAAMSSTPPSIRNGAWDVKRVLGTTPIHEDGSCLFLAPARTPLYFQVLDANQCAIQTMRSWSTLQPNEFFSCTGCHEGKNEAAPSATPVMTAMKAAPAILDSFYGSSRGFSFPKEIQPILNKSCIACHDQRDLSIGRGGRTVDGWTHAFSLLGTETVDAAAKRRWSDSYLALTHNGDYRNELVNWSGAQSVPSMLPPYSAGAARSRLFQMLKAGHHGVTLNQEELSKIACWIDLFVPYCGTYTEANAWTDQERQTYQRFADKRRQMQALETQAIQDLLRSPQGENGPMAQDPGKMGGPR